MTELRVDPRALVLEGRLIEAIKTTREQTGISLNEAKDAVDAFLVNPQSTSRTSRPVSRHQSGDIPLQVILFWEEGSLLNAIKTTREAFYIELRPSRQIQIRIGQAAQTLDHQTGDEHDHHGQHSADRPPLARKEVTPRLNQAELDDWQEEVHNAGMMIRSLPPSKLLTCQHPKLNRWHCPCQSGWVQ
jgi:hypothetical protein